jgi:hypothetical protein
MAAQLTELLWSDVADFMFHLKLLNERTVFVYWFG